MDSNAFITALDFTMAFEDPKCACAVVPDVGGYAISGINSSSFPSEYATIAAASPSARAPMVKDFYHDHFWNSWLEGLADIELQKRVFDASVNMGAGTAVKLLQKALSLAVDGVWGPKTLAAANSSSGAVAAFINARTAHYEDIVAKNPASAKYLDAWLARARK